MAGGFIHTHNLRERVYKMTSKGLDYSFSIINDSNDKIQSCLYEKSIKDCFIQWNLLDNKTLSFHRFRFTSNNNNTITNEEDYNIFLRSFVSSDEFISKLNASGTLPLDYTLNSDKLETDVTNMSFFDRLDKGKVSDYKTLNCLLSLAILICVI